MEVIKERKYLIAVILLSISAVIYLALRNTDKIEESAPNKIVEDTSSIKSLPQNETISGNITVSGYIPESSRIDLLARKVGEIEFEKITNFKADSQIPWSFENAENNEPYELKAVITTPESVYESPVITVVAPAQNEELRILSKASPSQSSQTQKVSKISGQVVINGVIPSGSTISLLQKLPGEKQFSTFGENILAKNGVTWNWSAATGNTYEIIAYLISGGNIIGTSNTITASAPSANETLTINSQTDPILSSNTSISGTLDINGIVPQGSFASIGVRKTGQTKFDLLGTNIQAKDGVGWAWNAAESGTVYEIQAYIQVGKIPIAQSQILTVTAPAKEQTLALNINLTPDAPLEKSLTSSCISKNEKDRWQVKLTMNDNEKIKDIQKFHLKFGTINNPTEFIDSDITPIGNDEKESVTTDYILTENTTYYASYAYMKKGISSFSPSSPPIKVSCN